MNNIQLFNFEGKDVRVVMVNDEPYFVAKDVADVLGIKNHRDAISKLKDSMKGVANIDTLGGNQDTSVINEAGVYKLAFTSCKPEAERFTDYLAEVVIPTIRKTGKFDVEKQQLNLIEDEFEKQLRKNILAYNNVLKINPHDQIAVISKMNYENQLNTYLQQKEIKEIKNRQEQIENKFDNVKKIMEVIQEESWNDKINDMVKKISIDGYDKNYSLCCAELYRELEHRASCNWKTRLENLKERIRNTGAKKSNVNKLSKMDIIEIDDRLR